MKVLLILAACCLFGNGNHIAEEPEVRPKPVAVPIEKVPWTIDFQSSTYDSELDKTVFSYKAVNLATDLGDNNQNLLDHLNLGFPKCAAVQITAAMPQTEMIVAADPVTQMPGLIWDKDILPGKDLDISVTVHGKAGAHNIPFSVVNGIRYAVGATVGPKCPRRRRIREVSTDSQPPAGEGSYAFFAPEFPECSQKCGHEVVSRKVLCVGQNNEIGADSMCHGTKPVSTRDCQLPECDSHPPSATVWIEPNTGIKVGTILTCHYTYYDSDGDPETFSPIQWWDQTGLLSGEVYSVIEVAFADVSPLYCTVTPTNARGEGQTATSRGVYKINDQPEGLYDSISFAWWAPEFASCSAMCGDETQQRIVKCLGEHNEIGQDSDCADDPKPPMQRSCGLPECGPLPTVSNVFVLPSLDLKPGVTLTCHHEFSDPLGRDDESVYEWYTDQGLVGSEATLTLERDGDYPIACEVTPRVTHTEGGFKVRGAPHMSEVVYAGEEPTESILPGSLKPTDEQPSGGSEPLQYAWWAHPFPACTKTCGSEVLNRLVTCFGTDGSIGLECDEDTRPPAFFVCDIPECDVNPPTVDNVHITSPHDDPVKVGMELTCEWEYDDADGDIEKGTKVMWMDDEGALSDKDTMGATFVVTSSVKFPLTCEVTPGNALGFGATKSSETVWLNTKPKGFSWWAAAFPSCPSCGGGVLSRVILCLAENDEMVDDINCDPKERPAINKVCPSIECDPNPPKALGVKIKPSSGIHSGTVLTCEHTYADVDGDSEDGTSFRWFINNVPVQNHHEKTLEINRDGIFPVYCEVTPSNTKTQGRPVFSPYVYTGSGQTGDDSDTATTVNIPTYQIYNKAADGSDGQDVSYKWWAPAFPECTKTCGLETKMRIVVCIGSDASYGTDDQCPGTKPAISYECTLPSCDPRLPIARYVTATQSVDHKTVECTYVYYDQDPEDVEMNSDIQWFDANGMFAEDSSTIDVVSTLKSPIRCEVTPVNQHGKGPKSVSNLIFINGEKAPGVELAAPGDDDYYYDDVPELGIDEAGMNVKLRTIERQSHTTTFTYNVSVGAGVETMSSWVLGIPECVKIVASDPPFLEEWVHDRVSQLFGTKFMAGIEGGTWKTFAISFEGDVGEEARPFAVEGDQFQAVGGTIGPSCEQIADPFIQRRLLGGKHFQRMVSNLEKKGLLHLNPPV